LIVYLFICLTVYHAVPVNNSNKDLKNHRL